MEYRDIQVEVEGRAMTIRLNRPDRLNALGSRMRQELIDALGQRAPGGDGIRAVILTGSGNAFSSGADIRENTGKPTRDIIVKDLRDSFHVIAKLIRDSDRIFISAVNGVAAGAGISIALLCDMVFASPSARFVTAFQDIGLAPDTGLSYILSRASGRRFAGQLIIGGEFSAAEAQEAGLLRVVNDPVAAAREAARKVSEGGPFLAYVKAKRLVNRSLFWDFEEFLTYEAQQQADLAETHDFLEGVTAFREKRKAVFSGT
ncbi:enoyl-CoA hydratase/isomerase family protein [Thermogymnomonas acidicola]|uniref:enoyl-CoA hydratase-related protein n=1 Tax=Thermogymnomonas acidicola TaxID=399579 RepID=UPI0009467313|nr:enoyl-CoA hydratase-related protein [Thermogymnomonas acidicola]